MIDSYAKDLLWLYVFVLFCYELYKKSISMIRSDLFRIFTELEALRRIVFWFQLGDYELLGDAAMTINHIHV